MSRKCSRIWTPARAGARSPEGRPSLPCCAAVDRHCRAQPGTRRAWRAGIFLLTSGALPQTKLMPTGLEIDAERIKVARLVQQDRIAAIAGELGNKSMQ
jgi:hypothetical protein